MALINSLSLRKEPRMSERIAKQDITEVNDLGQTVVVVAAGQPIPEGVGETDSKAVAAPAENKARRAPAKKKG